MPTDHLSLCGHTLDGKYRVDALVAEGGFGVVYRAVHLRLKKPVALKVLKLKGLESERERPTVIALFEAEAETAARLDHPAIVKVLDFGVSPMPDGTEAPWMALDWVDGVALADDLRARRDTPGRTPAEVLALMRPVLSGLAKAHAMGVAHRDLKPRNLMLTARGEGGSWGSDDVPVKILDFGIAKEMSGDESVPASGDTSTRSLTVAFSLRYAAPEQVSATRTGPWTDVYQMGLVITELLANKSPYRGDDTMDVHMQIMASSRPTPARLGVDVGAWEAVLAKALAVKPADRHANAKELLDELTTKLPAEVPTATPGVPMTRPPARIDAVGDPASTLRPSAVRPRARGASTKWRVPVVVVAALGGAFLLRSLTLRDHATDAPAARSSVASAAAFVRAPEAPARPVAPARPEAVTRSESLAPDAGPVVAAATTPDAGALSADDSPTREPAASVREGPRARHGVRHERRRPAVLIAPVRVN